jgi:S-adenosyl-L-methionine hydrolase (adenosine-forming)
VAKTRTIANRQSQIGNRAIALWTDFGLDGVFAGVMKGVIAGINPTANVIDATHTLTPFDPVHAALLLKANYAYFPPGTIHVLVVDPGVGSGRRILAAQAHDSTFLAPDNGILSPVLEELTGIGSSAIHRASSVVVSVTNPALFRPTVSGTFHGRDIFAPVAAHLSLGLPLSELGPPAGEIVPLDLPEPKRLPDGSIEGEVILVDRFGNLITNIPRAMLARLHHEHDGATRRRGEACLARTCGPSATGSGTLDAVGQTDRLRVIIKGTQIAGIRRAYADVPQGALLAVIGSMDTVEIAANRASAKDLLRARGGDVVRITRT